jgi:biopolymer transport protein ExbD
MKIRRRKGLGFSETSASSDIAFLLIIYFLVIAGFNVNYGFLMNLPAKGSTRIVVKDDLMSFDMDAKGALAYNGAAVSLADAERDIRAGMALRPNMALVLKVDPNAPWQAVVSFVEVAQDLEVNSFSFTMRAAT